MAAYPSGTNTWVPSHEASGATVAFFRNPKKFAFNKYVSFRPATKMVGLFLELTPEDSSRVVTDEEFVWPDGSERPSGNNNLQGFEFKEYRTIRRDFPVTLGNLSIEQASWDIVAAHTALVMQQAATLFTMRIVEQIEDGTTNFANYKATATALSGGKWDVATVANPYIKKSFNAAVKNIHKQTGGMVGVDQICCVISPTVAQAISESAEFMDYLKGSPTAYAQVQGTLPNANVMFGLPETLYGVQLVVEDAVRTSTRKGVSQTTDYIKNADGATFMSKIDALPGDQVGDFPTPNFSTLQTFYYGEDGYKTDSSGSGFIVVETWDDVRNKRKEAHAVMNTCEKMVAARSGFLVTAVRG